MRLSVPRRVLVLSLLAAGLAACGGQPTREAAPAAAAEAALGQAFVDTGDIAGAPYRIERPADWNGDLVVLLHGYEPVGTPRTTPMEQDDFDRWALGRGYAIARSAYATQGWAVAEAVNDSARLQARAVSRLGHPKRTLLVGNSMGGHLALALVEAHPETYDGALVLCGVNTPAAEVFAEGVLPPLLAFDFYFPGVMGLPAAGLADAAAPPFIAQEVFETALQGDEARANDLAERFDILRADFAGALMLRYLVLRELSVRAGGFPLDNRNTTYSGFGDDAAFNNGVRRYAGDPTAMAYLAANAPLSGTATRPVVIQSNENDPTVPFAFGNHYAVMARAAGNGAHVATLPPVGQGHCAFDMADVDRAFQVLADWVGSGQRPALP